MQSNADMRVLRDDMLTLRRQSMIMMVRDLEASEIRRPLGGYQFLGDLLRRLGQSDAAIEHYGKVREEAEKIVKEQPTSDLARTNLAVILMRLGDIDLERYGEVRKARDIYEEGRRMRQEVADHPRSHDHTHLDNKRNVSHFEMRLGKAELARGDPDAALAHFKKCLELRKAWVAARPTEDEAQDYLAQAYQLLAITRWHTGDMADSRQAFTEAVAVMDGLLKKHKNAYWYMADSADILGTRGDAELAWGMLEQAEKTYQESLANLKPGLAKVPDNAEYQSMLALTRERMAVITQRKGNAAAAKQYYGEALNIRGELLGIEPNNVCWQGAGLRIKAHTGDVAIAVQQLEMLYRRRPRSIPLLLEAARACATGTAQSADPAVKKRYVERALGALHAALRAGYRDVVALKSDPNLAPLGEQQAFQDLLLRMTKP